MRDNSLGCMAPTSRPFQSTLTDNSPPPHMIRKIPLTWGWCRVARERALEHDNKLCGQSRIQGNGNAPDSARVSTCILLN